MQLGSNSTRQRVERESAEPCSYWDHSKRRDVVKFSADSLEGCRRQKCKHQGHGELMGRLTVGNVPIQDSPTALLWGTFCVKANSSGEA